MNKKVVQAVLERSQGLCEIEGCKSRSYIPQLHHIIKGKGKRIQCETEQSVICLCFEHHYGNSGVHGKDGHTLDMQLKLDLQQKYYSMGKSEHEVRKLMGGKLYEI